MMKQVLFLTCAALALALYAPGYFTQRMAQPPAQDSLMATVAVDEPAASGRIYLPSDGRGHFRADVAINGQRLSALVDTGASTVALRYSDARRMGLVVPGQKADARVNTANGQIDAVRAQLGTVRIGSISAFNVEALVLPDSALSENLLGMSFLRQLRRFEITQGRLALEG